MAERIRALEAWLSDSIGLSGFSVEPASGDASFRRYFRVRFDGRSFIAMDAPPDKEDCRPFVHVARRFKQAGLHVPTIHHEDLARGFLLLDDLGTVLYLDALNEKSVDRLYGDALKALALIQSAVSLQGLPPYDRPLLMLEMELFREWLVRRHLELELSDSEQAMLDRTFGLLAESALGQPRVCVHRDYHSRNLMLTEPNPGILDFQDAVEGPVTYDLVSLLRDCYIRWPLERVEGWAMAYFDLAVQHGVLEEGCRGRFPAWFDLMGVQRHLKAAGIFARLYRRDGKPGYLKDIPRTLGYIVEIAPRYPELQGLEELITRRVLPSLTQ